MTINKISIHNLTKSFGKHLVLDGINLDVKQGESLVIIGGSGSGKSVLIKCIVGLLTANSGSIMIDGNETFAINENERAELFKNMGFLFQGGALFDSLKIWENVGFSLIQSGEDKKNARQKAIETLKTVGLDEHTADLHPAELSGGMQKRVAIARAIINTPSLLFFDEPTSGLDPIFANVISDLIIKTSKKINATTITITHDMNSAMKIADKIAMIYKGKIIWCGEIEDLENCDNHYVTQFIKGELQGPIKV